MDTDKQKIIELLQKKLTLEKKKYYYCYQYHTWVENAWWKIAATYLLVALGAEHIKKENSFDKFFGWLWISLWILIMLLIFYKCLKFLHYYEKIRICERKISKIDKELVNIIGSPG